jgi:protocadherin Fat 4
VPAYTLTLGAIDTGSPPQTGTTTVRIAVQDVNDNGPVFDPPEVIGYVSENEPPNTSVMTLSATDPDLPPNGAPFTYRLVGGHQKDLLTVERQSGVVKTTRSIDRETTPRLDVVVSVQIGSAIFLLLELLSVCFITCESKHLIVVMLLISNNQDFATCRQ